MKKILLSFSVFCFLYWKAAAVNYPMTTGTYTVDCSLSNNFFDSGSQLNNYSNNESYTETFTSSSGQSLRFKFNSFSTQQGNDILTIYDGPNTSSTVIGQFSGTNSPGTIFSSTSSITFSFTSNSSTTSTGWAASIACVAAPQSYTMASGTVNTCDASFYDPGGSSSSYGNNLNITETFTSNSSGNCLTFTLYSINIGSGDTLKVYDGTTTTNLIEYWTNTNTLPSWPLLSSSGSFTFKFRSNNVNSNNSGWYAVLSCDPCPSALAATATYTMPTSAIAGLYLGANMVTTCSGTVTDDGGLSGNYSNNIGGSNGIYRVFCPNTADDCMRIQFYSIGIASSDYLSIYNSASQGASQSGSILFKKITNVNCSSFDNCMGAGYGPFTSYDPSGCLSLMFYSDNSTVSSGFSATLDCVPCADGPSGTDNTDCSNATALCSSSSLTAASLGPGLVSEAGGSCIGSENYSSWYKITFSHGGTLGLSITSVNSSDDYDFVLYGPNASCGSLGSAVRCSYAGTSYYSIAGETGMGNGANDVSENSSGNGVDGWVQTLNVTTGQTYYLLVSKWSPAGSGFTLAWNLTNGATLDCTVLPVTLTSFTCTPDNGIISLDWTSAAEVNNDHYLIEKSSDGENYSVFTSVPGKGTTTLPSEYFVADYHPFPGDNYYRLSQVDKDGTQEILKTTVCSSPVINEEVTFEVYDMSGRKIYSSKINLSDFNSALHAIDLSSGVYITAIIHGNGLVDLSKYLKL